MPNQIRIFVGGHSWWSTAHSRLQTLYTAADEGSLVPAPQATSTLKPTGLGVAVLLRVDAQGGTDASVAQPVIVHAEIDGDGNVVEAECIGGSNIGAGSGGASKGS